MNIDTKWFYANLYHFVHVLWNVVYGYILRYLLQSHQIKGLAHHHAARRSSHDRTEAF